MSNEQRLIAELDSLKFADQGLDTILPFLEDWLIQQVGDLKRHRLACDGLNSSSVLARLVKEINATLSDRIDALSRGWADLKAAEALADIFRDRVLLLVFGKFNSGKSSFCNLLAERFRTLGQTVRYFYIENGIAVESDEPFVEGTTEATARLQGVRLGRKFVILDTPGLHSIRKENASLTQRFVESADGLLWLTSSTSPGQVQELEELSRELRRHKPLLPVVTRSDFFDEDEIDGEICKVLCNKSAENRALQEGDIEVRAKEKLAAMGVDPGLLKAPVSISAYLARVDGGTPEAMIDAGMERLYGTLLEITEAIVAYKGRKYAEILLHHLQENGVAMLRRDVVPLLDEVDRAAQVALGMLEQQQFNIRNAVWRSVVSCLPRLLDEYAEAQSRERVYKNLSRLIISSFSRESAQQLEDYELPPQLPLEQDELLIRSELLDVVSEQEADVACVTDVDVDYRRLYESLEQAVRHKLVELTKAAVEHCSMHVGRLTESAAGMRERLQMREAELLKFERRVRAECP